MKEDELREISRLARLDQAMTEVRESVRAIRQHHASGNCQTPGQCIGRDVAEHLTQHADGAARDLMLISALLLLVETNFGGDEHG